MISPRAWIAEWAELGADCVVHSFAVVGRMPDTSPALARQPQRSARLKIGNRVKIGCHAVIYGGVEIGDDTLIGDFASIREGTVIGERCVIGRYVAISYDCLIADDCRFQDHTVFIGSVGHGSFFGVGVTTSNDRRVDLVEYHHADPAPPRFGKRVMVGSGATILAGVTIGDDAVIGAGATVVKDVPAHTTVLGPAAKEV